LLAILAATIAYQAGVDPPGGVWAESGEGHMVGDPILLTTHPVRYKVFFYFNSASLVASLVIMVMLQSERLVRRHALEAAMILDLFGLIGAYAAGSGRDTSTSVYTVALAGGVLIYVVIHIVFFTLDSTPPADSSDKLQKIKEEQDKFRKIKGEQHKLRKIREEELQKNEEEELQKIKEENKLQKRRDVLLLLLSVLGATLAYQAGLTPPGGFWEEDDKSRHRAGFPVLLEKYPLRYRIFYYCNAASFMASVALIVLLMNQNLYRPGIRCYALYVCMIAGMFGLMGAYSAGSYLHLRTSIIVLVLVSTLTIASFTVAIYARHIHKNKYKKKEEAKKSTEDKKKQDEAVQHNNNQDGDGLPSIVIVATSNGQPHATQAVSTVQDEATREETEKKKKKVGRFQPDNPEEEGGPGRLSAHERVFLFLFPLHSTDTRVPPVGETRRLTCGPLDIGPLTGC